MQRRHPFSIGTVPDYNELIQQMHLEVDPDRYKITGETVPGGETSRIRFEDLAKGETRYADFVWGSKISEGMGRSLHRVYKGRAEAGAPVAGRVEPEEGFSIDDPRFSAIRPARQLARSFAEATETGKSLDEVLSKQGVGFITGYASQSLAAKQSRSVPLTAPKGLDYAGVREYYGAVRHSLASGDLGHQYPNMVLSTAGGVPRLVPSGATGWQEREIDVDPLDPAGSVWKRTVHSSFPADKGQKWAKHGQGMTGGSREEAIPLDATGMPLKPKPFEFSMTQDKSGVYRAKHPSYVQMQTRFPWQEKDAPLRNVVPSLSLIPSAYPFSSGASLVDTSVESQIGGYGIRQPKFIDLKYKTEQELRGADLKLTTGAGTEVQSGTGGFRLGSIDKTPLEVQRMARDAQVVGHYASIPAHYYPSTGEWAQTEVEGRTRPTTKLAAQLSKKWQIPVERTAEDMPFLGTDYLSRSGGAPKGMFQKSGETSLTSGHLSVNVAGKAIRVENIDPEIKGSMPGAILGAFGIQSFANQIGMVERIGSGVGKEMASLMQERYPDGITDVGEIAEMYSRASGGERGSGNILKFGEAILGTFLGASDKLETLERYGIAHVEKGQWIEGPLMSEGEMREQKIAQEAMVRDRLERYQAGETGASPIAVGGKEYTSPGQTTSALSSMFAYAPEQLTAGGPTMYRASFFAEQALIAPTATEFAPEMSGRGTLNYRQIAGLSEFFPETAKALGLNITDPSVTEESFRDKRAWKNMLTWEAYDLTARRMRGTVFPRDSQMFEGVSSDEAKLMRNQLITAKTAEMTDADKLDLIDTVGENVLGKRYDPSKMLYFDKTKMFMPGTETIRGIDAEETGLPGTSATKIPIAHWSTFQKNINAQARKGAVPMGESLSMNRGYRSMFNKRLGQGGIVQKVLGYNPPGMSFHRYSGMSELNPGEIYLPQKDVGFMLRTANLSTKEQQKYMKKLTGGWSDPRDLYAASQAGSKQEVKDYLYNKYDQFQSWRKSWDTEGGLKKMHGFLEKQATQLMSSQQELASAYLPALGLRQPDTGRMNVTPQKVLTEHQMASRGVDPERIKNISAGTSSLFSIMGVGDWDRDPMQVFLAIGKNKELVETDEMKQFYSAYSDATASFKSATGASDIRDTQSIMEGLFGKQASSLHILRDTVSGFLDYHGGGKPSVFTQGMGGRTVPFEERGLAEEMTGQAKESMAGTYNTLRMLESSAGALGIYNAATVTENVFNPFQLQYQLAIDLSSKGQPMVDALKGARVSKSGGFGTMIGGEWKELIQPKGEVSSAIGPLLSAIGASPDVGDTQLAHLFATSDKGAAHNVKLLERFNELQKQHPDTWGKRTRAEVLQPGGYQIPGMKPADVGVDSVFMTSFLASGVSRTLGSTHEKYKDIQESTDISFGYHGEQKNLREMRDDPLISMTNFAYSYQTRKGTGKSVVEWAEYTGNVRELLGGKFTKENISMVEKYTKMAGEQIIGKKTMAHMEKGSGRPELQYRKQAEMDAINAYDLLLTEKMQEPPVIRGSDLAAYIAGDKFNSREKIVATRMGLDQPETNQMAVGREINFMKEAYPFTPGKKVSSDAERFERGWKANAPGASDKTVWASMAKAGGPSIGWDYRGARMTGTLDWLGYDPEKKKIHVTEHKMMSAENAEYGKYQVSNYARGLRQAAAQEPDDLRAALKGTDLSKHADEMVDLLSYGTDKDVEAWVVAKEGTGEKGSFVYTDPIPVDWTKVEEDVIAPTVDELTKMLGTREGMARDAGKVIRRGERDLGLNMNAQRAAFSGTIEGAPPLPPDPPSTAVATPAPEPSGGGGVSGGGGAAPITMTDAQLNKILESRQQTFGGGRANLMAQRPAMDASIDALNNMYLKPNFGFGALRENIMGVAAGALGISPAEAEGKFGAVGGLANAVQEASFMNPLGFSQGMIPFLPQLERQGGTLKRASSVLKSTYQMGRVGLQSHADKVTMVKNAIFGADPTGEGAAFGAQLGEFAQVSSFMTDTFGKGGAKLAMGGGYSDTFQGYVETNIERARAQEKVAGLGPDAGFYERYQAKSDLERTTLQSKYAKSDVAFERAKFGFREAFGTSDSPIGLGQLAAFEASQKGEYTSSQARALTNLKEATAGRHEAGAALGAYDSSQQESKRYQGAIDRNISHIEAEIKAREDLAKVTATNVKGSQESSKAIQNETVLKAKRTEQVIADQIAGGFGKGAGEWSLRKAQGEAVSEMRRIAQIDPALRTPADRARATEMDAGIQAAGQAEDVTRGAAQERVFGRQQRSWGGLARRAFGGFGLMYMNAMFGRTFKGVEFGYKERLEQDRMVAGTLGARLGGIEMLPDPEMEVQRATALAGGSGKYAARQVRAGIMQSAPGIETLGRGAFGGAMGFAGTTWLASLGGPAAALGPWAPAVGLTLGMASVGLEAYGAHEDELGTAVGVAGRIISGDLVPAGPAGRGGLLPASFLGKLGVPFDVQLREWASNKEVEQITSTLTEMHRLAKEENIEPYEALDRMGINDSAERDQMLNLYAKAKLSDPAYKAVPEQGLVQMVAMEAQYGRKIAEEGPQYAAMATALAQGVPYEQTALGMAQATGAAPSQQYGITGGLLQRFAVTEPSTTDLTTLAAGAQRLSSLGAMAAPGDIPSSELEEMLKTYADLPAREFDVFSQRFALEQQRILLTGEGELPTPASLQEERDRTRFLQWLGSEPTDTGDVDYATQIARRDISGQWEEGAKRPTPTYRGDTIGHAAMVGTPPPQDLTPEQYADALRQIGVDQEALQPLQQLYSGFKGMGYADPLAMMNQYAGTRAEMTLTLSQMSAASSISGQLMTSAYWGFADDPNAAQAVGRGYIDRGIPLQEMNIASRALGFDRDALTQANAMRMTLPRKGGEDIVPYYLVGGDIDLYGEATGKGLFSSSMRQGRPGQYTREGIPSGIEMASVLWGADWAQVGPQTIPEFSAGAAGTKSTSLIQGMVEGVQMPFHIPGKGPPGSPYLMGGTQAMSFLMSNAAYQNQMAGIGNAMAQINLGYAFQTGVGIEQYAGTINPQTGKAFNFPTGKIGFDTSFGSFTSQGGGMWGVQDAQRALKSSYAQYGFDVQRRQMEMQDRFFWQNTGLSERQSGMQRQFAQEDWAFQDQTRGLQWQWAKDDFAENIRFTSGRERKISEKQMARESIMHGLEGEQIDKKRQQQEELWKLEDERYETQKAQHEEALALQEEQLEKAEEYWEEQEKLQEMMIQMQRAYYIEQIELQKQALGIQAAAAKQQKDAADMALAISILESDALKDIDLIALAGDEMFKGVLAAINLLVAALPGGGGGGGGGGPLPGEGGENWDPEGPQIGANFIVPPLYPNDTFRIGVSSGERVQVTPSAVVAGSTYHDPWQDTALMWPFANDGNGGVTYVTVKVGEDTLGTWMMNKLSEELEVV